MVNVMNQFLDWIFILFFIPMSLSLMICILHYVEFKGQKQK